VSSNTSRVPSEWNNLFVLNHILQVCNCLLQVPALNGTSNLISVLVVSSKVSNLAFSLFSWLSWLSRVLNHCKSLPIY
jgi:hypothetical protein